MKEDGSPVLGYVYGLNKQKHSIFKHPIHRGLFNDWGHGGNISLVTALMIPILMPYTFGLK